MAEMLGEGHGSEGHFWKNFAFLMKRTSFTTTSPAPDVDWDTANQHLRTAERKELLVTLKSCCLVLAR